MRLLVLAQTPPPVHGQSLMIESLLEGLHLQARDIEVIPVDLDLSNSTEDIGRMRLGKLFALLKVCRIVRREQKRNPGTVLYYVPAPGKYSAVLRDWLVMALCRRGSKGLVYHWHTSGLGAWLAERRFCLRLTRFLCGRPDLSITHSSALAEDVAFLSPKKNLVVSNGIRDPITRKTPPYVPLPGRCRILFLGLCTETKGLFVLLKALKLLQSQKPGVFTLTIAGDFNSEEERERYVKESLALGNSVVMAGFVRSEAKRRLLAETDVVCLPTWYPHESQPLVALEAMAADKKLVVTDWRALPETVTPGHSWVCEPQNPEDLARALLLASEAPEPAGAARQWWQSRFTTEHHLDALAAALRTINA